MSAAALGARARPLPDGADSSAALTACASSAGAALALALLALAFAAPDIISTAPAQMRTAVKGLPPPDEQARWVAIRTGRGDDDGGGGVAGRNGRWLGAILPRL